jgi:hypothetical protein
MRVYIRRMALALEIDMDYINVVPFAPHLEPDIGEPYGKPRVSCRTFAGRLAALPFLIAQGAHGEMCYLLGNSDRPVVGGRDRLVTILLLHCTLL